MANGLRGKVALVTGASSGIGEALAREMVRRGALVALVARRADRLQALATDLGEAVLPLAGDVTSEDDLHDAVKRTLERFSRLDVAVANAGFGVAGRVERLTVQDFQRQLDVNFFGVLRTLYASLPSLKASRGSFAIIGSVNSFIATPKTVPYAASKFAVRALADGLRLELHRDGIAVTLVCPGFVDSEIRRTDNLGVFHEDAPDPVPRWLRMTADVAARKIAGAIAARRREVVITGHGKAAVFIARHLPRTTAFLLARGGSRSPRSRSRVTHPEG